MARSIKKGPYVEASLLRHGVGWRDTRRLFLLIAALLFVQAILEMLYVRQVLLHGGSGVPLAPY